MRCDSHVHIVGSADRYPQVADRTYLADVATLKQLDFCLTWTSHADTYPTLFGRR